MPDGFSVPTTRDDDPYNWALELAARLRGRVGLKGADREALGDFLEEWAEDMLGAVRSQMVNLLAHAAKAASTRNPEVIGHWRSQCVEFHDQMIDAYRPSMRDKIDVAALWRRAQRKVIASFDDNGEPRATLPARCPISLDDLLDPELDLDRLVEMIRDA